ncbi:MAG: hypothetical protein FWH25_03865 [Syntrophorhabdaceae bacterium]|nr:hypothetical protein [Syntrophorhabdaceae bacterium]
MNALSTTVQGGGMSLFGRMKAALQEVNIDLEAIVETYAFFSEQMQQDADFKIPTYRAKVPAGGGSVFEILTGDEDMDTVIQRFSGVVAAFHNTNVMFESDEDGAEGTNIPLCQSSDGKIGLERETGEAIDCATCPHNQWGTDKKAGRGKACKNMRRLYVLVEGCSLPIVLSLSPTSIRGWEAYRAQLAVDRKTPLDVITEFSLKKETNKEGKPYSVVKFKAVGALSAENRLAAKTLSSSEPYDKNMSHDDYDVPVAEGENPASS